jgi:hypothetical protein
MADLVRLPSARPVTRRPSRPATVSELGPRLPAGTVLALVDLAIADAERALVIARAYLPRSRGAGRARLVVEIEELVLQVVALEAKRAAVVGVSGG